MKINPVSDLHHEHDTLAWRSAPVKSDVVIIAGDSYPGTEGILWAIKNYPSVPVIYIAGNHEFYGAEILSQYENLRNAAKGTNVHFLQNDSVVIDGVRFIGATLWTDFNFYGYPKLMMPQAPYMLNDYVQIKCGTKLITPEFILQEHMVSRQFIFDECKKPFDGKTVVVTHHAPSELSVHSYYKGDPANALYASKLENEILNINNLNSPGISLWVHGHMHYTYDYMIGSTRVICNPRGYRQYHEFTNFKEDLIVEI